MSYSNFSLNQRINNVASQVRALSGSSVTLSGNNNFIGDNNFEQIVTCDSNATTGKQLVNYETASAMIAGGGS